MISIFEVFRTQNYQDGMNKNQICRNTGIRNKGPLLKTIMLLEKESILSSKKVNKQKEIIKLTPLGQEIIDLINDIDTNKNAYSRYKETIFQYMKMLQIDELNDATCDYDKILMNRLLRKGWTKEECESFDEIMYSLRRGEIIYRENICNSLLNRYYVILSNFKTGDSTRSLLIKIVLNEVNHQMSLQQEDAIYDNWNNDDFPGFNNLADSLLEEIEEEYRDFMESNRFTSEVIKSLISSLLFILKPTGDELHFTILDTEANMRRLEEEISSINKGPKSQESHLIKLEKRISQLKELLEIIQQYVARYKSYVRDTHTIPKTLSTIASMHKSDFPLS